ncbi:MAG: hypothetical protein ABIS50_15225 [Luteolibacter sp.]|uniref:hypothetical protein n=1 Tax=Luteolibacter sp. TaxID=1962973 RepID=UPI0032634593
MTDELITETAPDWTVITLHVKQSKMEISQKKPKVVKHHELLYQGKCHLKKPGQGGLETLRDMARFMNKRQMKPRAKIECVADEVAGTLSKRKNLGGGEPLL